MNLNLNSQKKRFPFLKGATLFNLRIKLKFKLI